MFVIKLKKINENLYLIIPIGCIILWFLLFLLHHYLINSNLILEQSDFLMAYNAGKQIFIDPVELYNVPYYQMPAFATVLSVTISLLPNITISNYSFLITILILAIIFVYEYNQILILMGLKEKFHRFLFLMIISNGVIIYYAFYLIQYKINLGVILLFVLRREIQYRKNGKEKDLKYYFVNYGLFAFGVSTFPPSIFLLLIYLFIDIRLVNIFKKENIKKYIIVLFMFLIQNFLFFIYPSLIYDFLGSYNKHNTKERKYVPLFYIREWLWIYSTETNAILFAISVIYISIITIILMFNTKLPLEEKYAFFAFAAIIFFTYAQRMFLILLPLALLLFIPFINQNAKGINFLKKNKIAIMGLLSIVAIYFMLPDFTIYKYFPKFQEYPYFIFMLLRYILLLTVFVGSVLILYLKKAMIYRNSNVTDSIIN